MAPSLAKMSCPNLVTIWDQGLKGALTYPPLCLHQLQYLEKKGSCFCAIGATISGMYNALEYNDINDAINKFIFATGILLHVTLSPYYKEMVQAIAATRTSCVVRCTYVEDNAFRKGSVQY
jgi:hypothetical protein